MKLNNTLIGLTMVAATMSLSSCENQDIDFPDYEGGISVYFPYQSPIRTIVLGTDEYDTSLDKAHKCKISATMGGAYKGRNIVANVAVADSLCKNLKYENGTDVKVMPTDYYSLASNQIAFNGNLTGSVEVQLTDAFFADPESAKSTYVIPLLMTGQTGASRILTGEYEGMNEGKSAPARLNVDAWKEPAKDYILYCVNYKSKYDAYYVRCGKYSLNGKTAVQIPDESTAKWQGHFDPVVDGDECNTVTVGLNTVDYSVKYTVEGVTMEAILRLTFDGSDNCTVTSLTEGVEASGNGKYVAEGAKKAWGEKDRDQITLNFTLTSGANSIKAEESLVWIRSGVSLAELSVKYVAE